MRKLFKLLPLILIGVLIVTAFKNETHRLSDSGINWMTIEEVEQALEKEPRKVFVDVYTKWCGPCKMMDKLTFGNQEVIDYVNKHYYAVKFDAEQKNEVKFKGKTYSFNKNMGRYGIHEAVFPLTDSKLQGYPTIAFLDENLNVMWAKSMYFQPSDFLSKLKYYDSVK